jgi:L-iditol 2-dehydrogenase
VKTAVLYGKEDVRLEERPTPRPGPGEILLKVKAALTCGTDLKVFRNGGHARMIKPPAPFGHEFAGVVEAVGPGANKFKPGTRVVGANSAPCRACFFCRKGQPNLCQDLLFVNGAYAEYLLLPARLVQENLLEIPASLSFEAAALTEPLACVVRGVEAVSPAAGETAVILGAGPVGLMFLQLVRKAGAKVILVGKGESRLKAALACGAEAALDLGELSDPVKACQEKTPEKRGADLVIEAVGRPAAWSQALKIVRPGGRVLLFGGCPSGTEVPLDTRRMHYDELNLISTCHHTPEAIRKSLSLLAKGVVDPKPLITRQAPLEDLPEILHRMLTQADGVKTAIIP